MNLQQRIDDFLEERANAESDWDEQQSAFTDFVEMELLDQRKRCSDDVKREGYRKNYVPTINDYINACLNAVEKSDESV